MFDQLKNLGNMMQQAQQLQGKVKEAKEKAAELRVEGGAGGDMVKVEASGDLKITAISIDPSLLEGNDQEMLEDLVLSATNQALQKAKEAAAESMSEIAGGMNIPGMEGMMSKFGLGG